MTTGVGTPAFMAPELLSGQLKYGAHYGTSVDVYSFGVLCWAMWARRMPYADLGPNVNIFSLMKVSE